MISILYQTRHNYINVHSYYSFYHNTNETNTKVLPKIRHYAVDMIHEVNGE